METTLQRAAGDTQPASLWKYIWITFGTTLACGIAASILQAMIGTSLSVASFIALIISIRYCGQKFFRDHARIPSSQEAMRYAVWTTLLQAIPGGVTIAAIAVSDARIGNDPVFWQIMGGVGLLTLLFCFFCARYMLVSSAKSAASAAAQG